MDNIITSFRRESNAFAIDNSNFLKYLQKAVLTIRNMLKQLAYGSPN